MFLDCFIHVFLDKLFYRKSPDANGQHQVKTIINFSLPFTGSYCLQIRTEIQKLCSSAFPDISLRFIFGPGRRLSSSFHFENGIPKLMRSSIVYQHKCQCYGGLYFDIFIHESQNVWEFQHCIHSRVFSLTLNTQSLLTTSPSFLPPALVLTLNW